MKRRTSRARRRAGGGHAAIRDATRLARRADARAEAESRWRQTMRGPDWDARDLEWRPTAL